MPGDAEVAVWITTGAVADAAHHRALLARLSEGERARLEAIAHHGRRTEFLVGRALLRTALATLAPIPPHDWPLRIDPRGRPEVIPGSGALDLRFSLTHTDGLVACSVATGRAVGIDVERHRPLDAVVELARRFLAPSEADAIAELPQERRGQRYVRHWTLREAFAKARGEGLTMPRDTVAFAFGDDGSIAAVAETATGRRWHCWQWDPTSEHTLAVCVDVGVDEAPSLRVEPVIL
jgi:4'-phosphopantetheinyl transferase